MRYANALLCLASALLLVLAGCGSDNPGGSGTTGQDWDDYTSIAVGMWYSYDLNGFDLGRQCTWEGTRYDECLREVTHDGGFSVYDMLEIDDEIWNCDGFEWTEHDSEHVYIRVTSGQLMVYETLSSYDPAVMLQAPLQEGATWEPFEDAPFEIIAEILDTDATLDVPAGEFTDCVVVEITVPEEEDIWVITYYAPNVGPIAMFTFDSFEYEEEVLREYGYQDF
jgi:hypothetical protein